MTSSSVVAVIASYRRPKELSRLLASLALTRRSLAGVVVVDNGVEAAATLIDQGNARPVYRVAPGRNLGCGGGLRLAEQNALERFPSATHLWILDDDAVVEADTLNVLLAAMANENTQAAHPLVIDESGFLGWFPGLLDRKKFRIIRDRQTPEEFVARCGPDPIPFSWSQGIALLVTRQIIEQIGFHRDDFWVRGEDLEFSLRLTATARGIYVPVARVAHLPPAGASEDLDSSEYAKHRAMLQNLAYTSVRLRHGRPLLRTLPGNWIRFARTWGWRPIVMQDAVHAFLAGALLRGPAGHRTC